MARDDDAEASERLLRTMDAAAEASTSADRRRVRRAAFVTAACCAAVAAATTYAGANGRWTRGDGAALRAVDEDLTRLSYDPRAMSIGYDGADASSTLGAKNETEGDRRDEALVGANDDGVSARGRGRNQTGGYSRSGGKVDYTSFDGIRRMDSSFTGTEATGNSSTPKKI